MQTADANERRVLSVAQQVVSPKAIYISSSAICATEVVGRACMTMYGLNEGASCKIEHIRTLSAMLLTITNTSAYTDCRKVNLPVLFFIACVKLSIIYKREYIINLNYRYIFSLYFTRKSCLFVDKKIFWQNYKWWFLLYLSHITNVCDYGI